MERRVAKGQKKIRIYGMEGLTGLKKGRDKSRPCKYLKWI